MRRKLDGVLLLDKPVGPSSSAVLLAVKRLLEAEKAGHAGTLDPCLLYTSDAADE